jgi:signal transduction histidine kinase
MRNPLSSVKINLQALRKKVEGDTTYSELADIASDQVIRLEKMLADLLSYGKPLHLSPTGISFGNLAKEVLELVRQEATERSVSVKIEDEFGQKSITADPEQARRALTNLVSNAIQAAPQGGAVLINAKIIETNKAIISVSDNGHGISETEKEKLFQPFFTTKEGGTGLGLANVKKIVEYHGWNISAENLPEGGAVFTILLTI